MGMTMDWSKIGCIQEPPVQVRKAEPLARHTSFRIGGPADYMAFPASQAQLAFLLRTAWQEKQTAAILGAGTNVLAADAGKRGLTICTRALDGIRLLDETTLEIECGASMARAAAFARDHGLTGLEFAHGIPGSVGGGVFMNAGAYDHSLEEVVSKSRFYDPKSRTFGEYKGKEHRFSYRHSVYNDGNRIILSAEFSLKKDDPQEIRARMEDYMQRRKSKQPLEYPSAGSVFKRYPGYFTAKLIEEAGLKGLTIGGAQVSPKHAGFIVNLGSATAADVQKLVSIIEEEIYRRNGIRIERELIYF